MSVVDLSYQKLCSKILSEGRVYGNRNRGVERLQIPSYTFRHQFMDGFPLIEIKTTPIKAILVELLWFLKGSTDVQYLNKQGVRIWNKDAYNWYKKEYGQNIPFINYDGLYGENEDGSLRLLTFEEFSKRGVGSVGHNYSYQWRKFGGVTDQIVNLIRDMKDNIMSSRLRVSAWNPNELDLTALPPCHSEFQIIGVPLTIEDKFKILTQEYKISIDNPTDDEEIFYKWNNYTGYNSDYGFELHWNQRSVDTLLGLPFNIASYGALALILEKLTGFKALGIEGTLKCVHFYDNQYAGAEEVVNRKVGINKEKQVRLIVPKNLYVLEDIEDDKIEAEDFILENYQGQGSIKVEMLAPIELK